LRTGACASPTTLEHCDDSNTLGADGCSATCQVEQNYTCAGQPSTCVLNAGATGSTTCAVDTDPDSLTRLTNTLNAMNEWNSVKQTATSLGMTIDFSTRLACNEGGSATHWLVYLPGSVPGLLTVLPENTPYRVTLTWSVGSDTYVANSLAIIHMQGTNPPELLNLNQTPLSR